MSHPELLQIRDLNKQVIVNFFRRLSEEFHWAPDLDSDHLSHRFEQPVTLLDANGMNIPVILQSQAEAQLRKPEKKHFISHVYDLQIRVVAPDFQDQGIAHSARRFSLPEGMFAAFTFIASIDTQYPPNFLSADCFMQTKMPISGTGVATTLFHGGEQVFFQSIEQVARAYAVNKVQIVVAATSEWTQRLMKNSPDYVLDSGLVDTHYMREKEISSIE